MGNGVVLNRFLSPLKDVSKFIETRFTLHHYSPIIHARYPIFTKMPDGDDRGSLVQEV